MFDFLRKKKTDTGNIIFSYLCDFDPSIEKNEFTKRIFLVAVKPGVKIIYKSPVFDMGNTVNQAKRCIGRDRIYEHLAIEREDGTLEKMSFPYHHPDHRIISFCERQIDSSLRNYKFDVVFIGVFFSFPHEEKELIRNGDLLIKKYFKKPPPPPPPPMSEKQKIELLNQRLIEEQKKKDVEREQEKIKAAARAKEALKHEEDEKKKLARENKALEDRLEIERRAKIKEGADRAASIRAEADALAYKEKVEADAMERRLKIQTDALEKEKALTLEILQMREKIESQDIKGANDTTALLMGLLNSKK